MIPASRAAIATNLSSQELESVIKAIESEQVRWLKSDWVPGGAGVVVATFELENSRYKLEEYYGTVHAINRIEK